MNSMSVKGVLEELRDDYVVDSDKIGKFPSKLNFYIPHAL